MADIIPFAEGFKGKRRTTADLRLLRQSYTYFKSSTPYYKDGVLASDELDVVVYQPVNNKFEVDERILLRIGTDNFFEFTEKLIMTILFRWKSYPDELFSINSESLAIKQTDFYKLVGDATKEMARRNMMEQLGFATGEAEEGEEDEFGPEDEFELN